MTKEESEKFKELCDGFSDMKSDIRQIITALAGSDTGAKGLVSQVTEMNTKLSQHQIDDEKHFMDVRKDVAETRTEQKKLKWWAGGIATAAGIFAWIVERLFSEQ